LKDITVSNNDRLWFEKFSDHNLFCCSSFRLDTTLTQFIAKLDKVTILENLLKENYSNNLGGNMGKKKFHIGFMMLILMFIMSVNIVLRVANIEATIETRNFGHDDLLRSEVRGISDSVDRTLNQFKEENLWIREANVQLINLDEAGVANIQVDFALNSLKTDEMLELVIYGSDKQQNKEAVQRIKLDNSIMRQSVDLQLDMFSNYVFDIEGTTMETRRGVGVGELDLLDRIQSRFDGDVELEGNENYKRLMVRVNNETGMLSQSSFVEVYTEKGEFYVEKEYKKGSINENFALDELIVKVYLDGKLIKELTDENSWSHIDNEEGENRYYFKGDMDLGDINGSESLSATVYAVDGYGRVYDFSLFTEMHIELDN